MKRYALAALLCLSPMVAMADGNELLSNCRAVINALDNQTGLRPENSYGGGLCVGVVKAVGVLGRDLPADMRSCVPEEVATSQAIRVVLRWLQDHPSMLHHDEVFLANAALQEVYPCK